MAERGKNAQKKNPNQNLFGDDGDVCVCLCTFRAHKKTRKIEREKKATTAFAIFGHRSKRKRTETRWREQQNSGKKNKQVEKKLSESSRMDMKLFIVRDAHTITQTEPEKTR